MEKRFDLDKFLETDGAVSETVNDTMSKEEYRFKGDKWAGMERIDLTIVPLELIMSNPEAYRALKQDDGSRVIIISSPSTTLEAAEQWLLDNGLDDHYGDLVSAERGIDLFVQDVMTESQRKAIQVPNILDDYGVERVVYIDSLENCEAVKQAVDNFVPRQFGNGPLPTNLVLTFRESL